MVKAVAYKLLWHGRWLKRVAADGRFPQGIPQLQNYTQFKKLPPQLLIIVIVY